MKFIHWKDQLPESGTGRHLLMWVEFDRVGGGIETTGIFYESYFDQDTNESKRACFVDYQRTNNDEYICYDLVDGNLIDTSDMGEVDLYWAYADEVYGKDPFEEY